MHPYEDVTVPFPFTYTGDVFGGINVDCASQKRFSSFSVKGGVASRRMRSASVHTVKDPNGFRPPTPYQGAKLEFRSGSAKFCYGTPNVSWNYCWHNEVPMPLNTVLNDGGQVTSNVDGLLAGWDGLVVPVGNWATGLAYVRQKALLNSEDRKLNLALSIAERQKTANMVAARVVDLANVALNLRRCLAQLRRFPRGGKSKSCEALKDVLGRVTDFPSLWLEYRYGWRNLVKDIYGAVEALQKFEDGSFSKYRTHSSARYADFFDKETIYPNYSVGYSGAYQKVDLVKTKTGRYFYHARYDYCLEDVQYRTLVDSGVYDPALLLWELLPYSFIIDWVWRVGDFLDAINATEGLRFLGGSSTYGVAYTATTKSRPQAYAYNVSADISEHPRVQGFKFTRQVESDFPIPNPYVVNPRALDLTQYLDAISLLYMALMGTSREFRFR